jgi:hypothetical protein
MRSHGAAMLEAGKGDIGGSRRGVEISLAFARVIAIDDRRTA